MILGIGDLGWDSLALPDTVSDEFAPISGASTGTAGKSMATRPFSPQEKEVRLVHRVDKFQESKFRGYKASGGSDSQPAQHSSATSCWSNQVMSQPLFKRWRNQVYLFMEQAVKNL